MSFTFNTVSVVGLGYIGLPTAAVFATHNVRVIGVDVNDIAVNTINKGEIHIVEPDLDIAVHDAVAKGNLRATLNPEPADAFLLAVPTPFKNGHEPDLSYIEKASKAIAKVLKKGDLVVLESTSPVGTTEKMADWLAEARPDLTFPQQAGEDSDVRIAHCPERVLPGKVIQELVNNDRVVGGMTPKCSRAAEQLYKIFLKGECFITNARTAEMCKLTENAFRDVNIAFANELSLISDHLEIDVWELIRLANRHPRVNILQPGCGVGGHCIAVDPWFIVDSAPEQARLIHQARNVNDAKPEWVIKKVDDEINKILSTGIQLNHLKIACLGITFKPDIDDLRESPALHITEVLSKRYPDQLLIVEPNITEIPKTLLQNGAQYVELETALKEANMIVLLVDHASFKSIKPSLRSDQRIFDAKGVWA